MQKTFAVIFDMDGVIADTASLHEKAWFSFCEHHNLMITSQFFRETLFGRSNRETLRILFDKDLPDDIAKSYIKEKEESFRIQAAAELEPLPGLTRLLTDLSLHGYKIALASSAPMENILFTLYHTGTSLFFDQITSADEISTSKPHPEIFLKTASKLGYEPERCVLFEDSFAGIEAGLSAGMKVIGVATTHPAEALKNTCFNILDFYEITLLMLEELFEL